MDQIIRLPLDESARQYEVTELPESEQFESFATFLALSRNYAEMIEPGDLMTGDARLRVCARAQAIVAFLYSISSVIINATQVPHLPRMTCQNGGGSSDIAVTSSGSHASISTFHSSTLTWSVLKSA